MVVCSQCLHPLHSPPPPVMSFILPLFFPSLSRLVSLLKMSNDVVISVSLHLSMSDRKQQCNLYLCVCRCVHARACVNASRWGVEIWEEKKAARERRWRRRREM